MRLDGLFLHADRNVTGERVVHGRFIIITSTPVYSHV